MKNENYNNSNKHLSPPAMKYSLWAICNLNLQLKFSAYLKNNQAHIHNPS